MNVQNEINSFIYK